MTQPIAIIGMAARFPGAADVDAFWDLIVSGREAIRDLSDEELVRGGVDRAWLGDPDYVKAAATLDDVDLFDAAHFDISGREAAAMDPQHRVFLETCWHALENAGVRVPAGAGSGAPVGVFAGSGGVLTSYLPEVLRHSGPLADPTASIEQLGSDKDFLATRVSYKLNLTGPSLTVQTACSTSLVAVHLAVQSLLRGECETALAGGVNIRLPTDAGHWYRRGGILSPDGRCRPFDVSAQGTIFGSGAGVVVLKPLADALRDGDTVYATILGTAINNDGGGKASYGAASLPGQLGAMHRALAGSGVDPASIGYLEAHGTGVPLGDPTEIGALKKIFGQDGACAIGSVKALIGHMEAASGIAGLIKAALVLHRGQIPPNPYFTAPHARLNLAGTGLFVNEQPLPMPGFPRRAAVNSLGIGGTNAFAVLEQAPDRTPPVRQPGHELVTISAKTPDALRELAGRWASSLREPEVSLRDLAYTSHLGRSALRHRLSVVADSPTAAADRIETWLRTGKGPVDAGETARDRPRVGFLFPGQSSEYAGMAVELYREHPAFRTALDRHTELFRELTGAEPLEVFADPAAQARAELLQPAVFLLQVALAEFWATCGVRPDAVAGHSLGEYAAACVAGVLSPEEGLALVCERGRAFAAVPGSGRMVAVGCDAPAELERLVQAKGGSASVAAYNAPERITVSGSDSEMRELEDEFRQRGWGTIALETTHAFHSALVAPVVPALVAAANRITHRAPAVPMVLNLTGTWAKRDEIGPEYWGRQLTSPVRFASGAAELLAGECTVLLEVGPGRTLTTSGRAQSGPDVVWLPGLAARTPDPATVLAHLGRLERAGVPVDWAGYYAPLPASKVAAPRYPFARTRHWIAAAPAAPSQELPDLHRLPLPQSAQRRYETTVSGQAPGSLADHEISGRLVVPGAYHTACLVEAMTTTSPESAVVVEDLVFPRALEVTDTPRRVQLVLTPAGDGRFVAQSLGLTGGADPLADASWQVHAEGRMSRDDSPARRWTDPSSHRTGRPLSAAELYPRFEAAGFRFGPTFQWIGELRLAGDDSTGDLGFAASSPRERTMAILDSCVQLAIAARIVRAASGDGVLLPFRIERAVFHAAHRTAETGVAFVRHRAAEASRAVADVSLVDVDGTMLLELVGLELRAVSFGSPAPGGPAEAGVYADRWEPSDAAGAESLPAGRWIVFADGRKHWRQAVAALEAAGSQCVIVEVGTAFMRHDDHHYELDPTDAESLARLFRETGPADVLHCLGLDPQQTRVACGSLPALARAAVRPGSVVLLTSGAVAVHDPGEVGDPYGAMLWGLGRSVALEAPHLGVRLIDADPRDLPRALGMIVGAPAEAAIRDGRVHRPRLHLDTTSPAPAGPLSADGCHLITGGTGALGLHTAAWLVRRGARHVVLASRRAPETPIGELRNSGARITTVSLDVTDETAVGRLVERARREWGGLRSVVHAAGVLDDALLPELSWDRFQTVLAPKVAGGWNLHRATLNLDLEHFILFSSTAALLGAPGQANYAAANAFLDGLAHHRRGLGLPALSVNWGPWAEGMVARMSGPQQSRFRDAGFTPLSPESAFAALDRLSAGPGVQYGVFTVDWSRYRARFPGDRAVVATQEPRDDAESGRRLRRDLLGADRERSRELVLDYLRGMLATRLGMSGDALHEDRSLQEAGLDSLVAVEVRGQIFRDLDVDLPLGGLLEGNALRLLAEELTDRLALLDAPPATVPAAAEPVPAGADHPLSYAQRPLLMLHRMNPDSASYNVAFTARFTAGFDSAAFHRAVRSLVGRHAALRTTFSRVGADGPDGARQTVHGWLEPDVAEVDAGQWDESRVADEVRGAYREPFDLATGPLFRSRVYSPAGGETVVLLTLHHAVCDFWSLSVLVAELEQLYLAEVNRRPVRLPDRNVPYADFVSRQRELIASERGGRARSYWHTRLSGELEPARWPRFALDPADTGEGGSMLFPFPAALADGVSTLAKEQGATPYAVLLTAFQVLVGRYTGQQDVLVGTPVAGRFDPSLAECVGNFVNPVVLRADLSDAAPFREQLARTRRAVVEALEHQDYPFELLVSELAPRRVSDRNPIFQAMFSYQKPSRYPALAALYAADPGAAPVDWAGLTAVPFRLDQQDDQLELVLEVVQDGDRLVGLLKYRKSVFSAAAARQLIDNYVTLLRAGLTDPGRSVAELPLTIDADRDTTPAGPVAATPPSGELTGHQVRLVTAAWQKVLGREDIGPEDNFFDLGGNSMLLMQVYEMLADETADTPLKVPDLFRYPTVTSLARRLGQSSAAAGASPDRGRAPSRRVQLAEGTARSARLRARDRHRQDTDGGRDV
ncbi:type I polyketide synthase [Actinoplanes derwentensis]|uniref:Acyl transferase domain-containing protein n=1 Tax=Actinoplanes derwentensis TaxID=113562 RepID=A0A1H2CI38_9ACTN|nr:type I polyketide synthase [Actinoplanes derwentensis]GID89593.1 hypothetical protein Ade03nite_85170 [Actinoplanes derwentensis]SDT70143.1 Acyl transferase domain-containing protein [Actinoplanes derwentensis]